MSTFAPIQLQGGIVGVGPRSGTNLATVSVTFPQPLPSMSGPIVTANTLQGNDYSGVSISDTFAVTITSVGTQGFTANIFRVDNLPNGQGWDQNLQLVLMVSTPRDPISTPAAPQVQNSVVTVGPQTGTNLATASVTFPQPFAYVPLVTANAVQGNDYSGQTIPDTFAVSITGVSTTGFTANIFRVDNIPTGQGWGQNLQLGWTAYLG